MIDQIHVKHFVDIDRVKKPSPVVLFASRLICSFFTIFSSKSPAIDLDQSDWPTIQRYARMSIVKQLNELLQMIKQKVLMTGLIVLDEMRVFPEVKQHLQSVTLKLSDLKDTFFGVNSHQSVKTLAKQLSGSKEL